MRSLRFLFVLATALVATVGAAHAKCYADYKAKRGAPMQLHYGIIELPQNLCDVEAARPYISDRIGADGWELLSVVSVFDEAGLKEREESAGPFTLRY
ncbi:MAG: hypothetical protein AAGF74_05810 [Pseudomonadota bacterium]